jgi:hypothetical protein
LPFVQSQKLKKKKNTNPVHNMIIIYFVFLYWVIYERNVPMILAHGLLYVWNQCTLLGWDINNAILLIEIISNLDVFALRKLCLQDQYLGTVAAFFFSKAIFSQNAILKIERLKSEILNSQNPTKNWEKSPEFHTQFKSGGQNM